MRFDFIVCYEYINKSRRGEPKAIFYGRLMLETMFDKKFLSNKYVLLAIILVITLLVYLVFIFFTKASPSPQTLPKNATAYTVSVQTLKQDLYSPNLLVNGQVESPTYTQFKAVMQGHISRIYVAEGDLVHKGQLLVEFDKRKLELELAYQQTYMDEVNAKIGQLIESHKADCKSLENEKKLLQLQEKAIKRLESLNAKQLVSDADVDAVKVSKIKQELDITQRQLVIDSYTKQLTRLKTELRRYELAHQQLTEELSNCRIMAPYEGRVAKLYAIDGDYLKTGDLILSAYNLTNVKVKAAISGNDVPTLRHILTKKLPLKALSLVDEQLFDLNLEKLSWGDIPNGVFKFTQGAERFALGQHVELCLNLPPVTAFAIPQTAIDQYERIYIVKDGYAKAITIKSIGYIYNLKNPEQIQVLVQSKLLKNGDLLITSRLNHIHTGLPVKPEAIA